jgi:hypothetical protein
LTKEPKTYIGGKNSLFNKWCWENWLSTRGRLKPHPYLVPGTKVNSRWIQDLNVRPETLKLLDEKIRKTLQDLGTGNYFWHKTPIA